MVRKFLLFFVILFSPLQSFAVDQYNLLAPFAGMTSVDLPTYLGVLFKVLIGISGLLAVLVLIYCGIKLMTSSSAGAREEARSCIGNALFGVIIAIGAWILLNTINPDLVSTSFTVKKLETTVVTPAAPQDKDESRPTSPSWYFQYKNSGGFIRYGKVQWQDSGGALCETLRKNYAKTYPTIDDHCTEIRPPTYDLSGTEKAARQRLCGNDSCIEQKPLGVNHEACKSITVKQLNCTSLEGLPLSTIDFIKSLSSACGCAVMITGGTEFGHTTHAANQPIFDLRIDEKSPLYSIVKGGQKNGSFNGNTKWLYNGYWFTDEVSAAVRHWHVCKDGTPVPPGATGNRAAAFVKACTKI